MSSTRRHPNVVNADELEPFAPPGKRPPPFAGDAKRLAVAAGGKHLGASLFRVPAGGTAVPMHAHHANEEAVYVLEGRGTLRLGKDRVEVRPGDWIAMPPGPDHAHQLLADRGEALLYLCVSTMLETEVVTYPDSNKLLAVSRSSPVPLRAMFRQSDGGVDYFDGEGEKR